MLQVAFAAWSMALYPNPVRANPTPAPVQNPEQLVQRIRGLVEAAEKALKDEDYELAQEKVDEADVLTAEIDERHPLHGALKPLLDRLAAVQDALDELEEAEEDVVTLQGEDLKQELDRVRAAEAGESYDFPIDLNDKVATWVHLFTTSRKGFMEGALSRATQYLPMVRQVFAEEGIPSDLAYLAVIESGFKNVAKSRANAVGMWQFIRDTGRRYGLDNTSWVDERRDPVLATRAAARYLKRIYETRGDWYLALAGYNCGPGKVDRAVAALGTKNYWDLCRSRYIPPDTRHYVPQILAAMLIGRNPGKYGLTVSQMQPYVYETVETTRAMPLRAIAKFADMDTDALATLNPELLKGTTPPGKHLLKVPPGTSTQVARALLKVPVRAAVKAYVIRKGDTPASVAKRFHLTVDELLDHNELKATAFKKGRRIEIPLVQEQGPVREARPKATEQAVLQAPRTPLPVMPSLPEVDPNAAPMPDKVIEPKVHTEEKVEERTEEKVEEKPGKAARAERKPSRSEKAEAKPRTHLVKRGETLYSIATRYGVEVKALESLNKIRKGRIQAGQKIRLPEH